MAPIRLPCLVGGECQFQTVQLEYEQAKPLLDGHMQYAHGGGAGAAGGKKPEKFPRPKIKMDSSAKDWSKFEVEWEYYKEEYTLALPSSGSSMPAAVTSSSRASPDPQEDDSLFRPRSVS